ncbi:MAG TPA: peptidylprolyl isomerase, partial [Phycisphaerales bacterium]|nr:peptidylprolyl isomerase [Phycisphaerales bacterium]
MPSPFSLIAAAFRPAQRTPADEPAELFEALEPRQLLAITIANPITDLSLNRGAPAGVINLANRYTDPSVSSVVRFVTNSGNLDMALFGGAAPGTVANFLSYVNSGAYNNSIFHNRQNSGGVNILHGGGFLRPTAVYNSSPPSAAATPQAIPTNAPIALENPTGHTRGTIAMFHPTGNVNGATSQFFFNVANNPS